MWLVIIISEPRTHTRTLLIMLFIVSSVLVVQSVVVYLVVLCSMHRVINIMTAHIRAKFLVVG